MTVRRLTPTSHSRSRVNASRRAVGEIVLATADGQLLDQNRRTAAETAGEHEAQVARDRHHLLQQGDDVAGDRQLLDRRGQPAMLDPVTGNPNENSPDTGLT